MIQLEDAFGDIVRKARYGLGLQIDTLARRIDTDVSTLQAIESYQWEPNRAVSDKLAAALGLHPERLFTSALNKWTPEPPRWIDGSTNQVDAGYRVQIFTFALMDANGYICFDHQLKTALIIDPGGDADRLLGFLNDNNLECSGILLTHGHKDHIDALPDICVALPHVPVVVNGLELTPPAKNITNPWHDTRDETTVSLDNFAVRVIQTPGHSPGHVAFLLDTPNSQKLAFVGDTLFAGSLGRAYEGPVSYDTLLAKAQALVALSGDTVFFPGHGPVTTAGEEALHNPFLP